MSWNKSKTPQESLEILRQLSELCAELGGPVSKSLYAMVENQDYWGLVHYEIDYSGDVTLEDMVYARQILGFYQKSEFLGLGVDKGVVAAKRFVEAERICSDVNTKLIEFAGLNGRIESVLHHSMRKIASILGDVPNLEDLKFRFGPGASTNVKGAIANPRVKLSAPMECSTDFSQSAAEFLSETPLWTSLHAIWESDESWILELVVVCGKVTFVPKNAKTHRSISIEPSLNSFFQLGVGAYIKDRLMRSGINLYDQSINQVKAMRGSMTGKTATVDVVMASDCVASMVVLDQFPFDWFSLLNKLRTAFVTLPPEVTSEIIAKGGMADKMFVGKPYELEKFSSMGNGYTFEIESLLFYGLCSGTCTVLGLSSEEISVYGDDLIIPVQAYDLLCEVLSYCGLSVNTEKSFNTGPFRESCGADYFNGFDIRPFYQKTLVSERTLFVMHNWFVRHAELKLARLVERLCDPRYILRGPDGFGDGHLIGNFELRKTRSCKRDGWDGGYFDTYSLKTRSFTDPLPGDVVLPAYSVYTRSGATSPTDPNVVRGTRGYARMSIYTLERGIFSRT